TFEHLKRGLVRVTLPLAPNLDVIDADGNVITNADRTVFVWRGVPSTNNVVYNAPYQLDGRAPTLDVQADGALHNHSQIDHEPSPEQLEVIADFEDKLFSSDAAKDVGEDFAKGRPTDPVDLHFPLRHQPLQPLRPPGILGAEPAAQPARGAGASPGSVHAGAEG